MSFPADREQHWQPRPLVALGLRLVSVLVPAAAGAASAYGFATAVPLPDGLARAGWLVVLVAISTLAAALAERVGRRFLPLAVLFRLSLVFPDRAPSRFAIVRGAGNVRQLERRIHDAREHGVDPEPARAAEQILGLVSALSAHDRKTRGHSERVRAFTDLVAAELRLADDDRDRLRWAALLHDIGKLQVPSRILNKPGRPDPREWERLQEHPAAGARIAAPLLAWLGPWGQAIEQHHERFAGGGYPGGLAGDDISLAARIVSVADSFEVMTAARSYKKPISVPAARRELATCAGDQFDPAIVRSFLNVSLGRLWWTVGPASWTALLPVIGPVQRASGQVAAAAGSGAAAVAVGAGTLLSAFAGTATAYDTGGGPAITRSVLTGADPGASEPGQDEDHGPGTDRDDDGGRPTDGTGTVDPGGGNEEPPVDEPPDPVDPDPVDEVLDDPGGAVGEVVDGATGAVDDVVDGAGETVDDVVDGTTDVLDDVVGAGTDALDTVTGGSSDAVDGVVESVTGTVDDAIDDVTDLTGGLLGG
ncbi:MAG TPA: HD domain-containing phosphohydrolase [Actinomycetota bacterium]|nr:HD domain-containing phosphohydrolase [Actinomycetota bacterium]